MLGVALNGLHADDKEPREGERGEVGEDRIAVAGTRQEEQVARADVGLAARQQQGQRAATAIVKHYAAEEAGEGAGDEDQGTGGCEC